MGAAQWGGQQVAPPPVPQAAYPQSAQGPEDMGRLPPDGPPYYDAPPQAADPRASGGANGGAASATADDLMAIRRELEALRESVRKQKPIKKRARAK
jgi:hypothetical protein